MALEQMDLQFLGRLPLYRFILNYRTALIPFLGVFINKCRSIFFRGCRYSQTFRSEIHGLGFEFVDQVYMNDTFVLFFLDISIHFISIFSSVIRN